MKLPWPYVCDYCGKQKGAANHWWMRLASSAHFSLHKWDEEAADDGEVEHICGQECATKAMAKWMEAQ